MGISFNASSLLSGNGINVNSVVTSLQTDATAQVTALQTDQTNLQSNQVLMTGINTDLSALGSAMSALSDPAGVMAGMSATSSESAIVTAAAQNGATAGNYSVVVSTLATTGTLYTDEVANATTSILPTGQSTGNLAVQIGGTGGTTADIAITAGSNDTLTTLAASINTQSTASGWGITATVVTDANGARLAISSQSTGSGGALAIAAATGSNTSSLVFEPPVGGTNANITINGIPYASTTNAVTGAIPDVTLSLTSADPATPVQLTVGSNTTAITSAVASFVVAYNKVSADLNTQFAVNASSNTQGPLGSDSALRLLQASLAADITYATSDATSSSSGFTNLAALGITMGSDGTMSSDSTTFDNAMKANPSAVANFFQNSTATGFANNFSTDLNNLTDPTTGVMSVDIATNQTQQIALTTQITNLQSQLAAQKTELEARFTTINASLEMYPFTLAEVNAELGNTSVVTGASTTPTAGYSTG